MSFKKIANDKATGTVQWFKVLGDPVANYDENGFEWVFDFKPDNIELFTNYGLSEKIKEGYIKFRRNEISSTGEKNKPLLVVDKDDYDWPRNDDTQLIGNGSRVEVSFSVYQTSYKGKTFTNVSPLKVIVLDHKKYVKEERKPNPRPKTVNTATQEENWSVE